MANFFDPITGEDTTRIDVRSGVKFRIGLYGGGPAPAYELLNVTTNPATGPSALLTTKDPAVRFIHESSKNTSRYIYEIDPAQMQSDVVRACYNGNDYSAPLHVTLESILEIRKGIATLARSFVPTAHYLWGTAGNVPDLANGNVGGGKAVAARMRAFSLDKKATDRAAVMAVRTAVQPNFDGYNTCAGRYSLYTETPDLDAFLAACQEQIDKGNTRDIAWDGAGAQKKLYPRKYHFRGAAGRNGAVCWGEACDGVRHFDCVGLVNYCIGKYYYQSSFALDIVKFRDPVTGMVAVTDDKDLMDGDVLLKPGNDHIAMLYERRDGWYVVQAADTNVGLTENDKFNAGSWNRFRMQSAFLRGKHA